MLDRIKKRTLIQIPGGLKPLRQGKDAVVADDVADAGHGHLVELVHHSQLLWLIVHVERYIYILQ